jgi:hypothetical protein
MSSGLVFSDRTDRMMRLRSGSVGFVIVDPFSHRNVQQSLVIPGQALEMRTHGTRYLLRFPNRKEMTDDLGIVSRLSW